MDFIPELPMTETGFNNVLVIVDKLTKYGIFIPTQTTITAEGTARLVFDEIISRYGIPRSLVSDRDSRWTSGLWEHICEIMGMKRALTTSYHPQADGQTEILNQTLETALRCFVNPERNDWDQYLSPFALSYNTTPHLSTGFSPAFLLYGYQPPTGSNLIAAQHIDTVDRSSPEIRSQPQPMPLELIGCQLVAEFEDLRPRSKDAMSLSQAFQRRGYNEGRLTTEFDEGDHVYINPHS